MNQGLWLQVLEKLPHDLAVEVLQNAPSSLDDKLLNLPEGLRPLAAHAHMCAFAATTRTAAGCAFNSNADLPSFDLVVIPSGQPDAPRSDDASDSVAATLETEST